VAAHPAAPAARRSPTARIRLCASANHSNTAWTFRRPRTSKKHALADPGPSDGLTEAQNPKEEMFGEERLLKLIRSEAPRGCVALEKAILDSVQIFTQGYGQTDDITIVLVERRPPA